MTSAPPDQASPPQSLWQALIVSFAALLAFIAMIWAGHDLPNGRRGDGVYPFVWSNIVWVGLIIGAVTIELFGPRRFGPGTPLQRVASRADGSRLVGPRLAALAMLLFFSVPFVHLSSVVATIVATGEVLRILAIAPVALFCLWLWGLLTIGLLRKLTGKT